MNRRTFLTSSLLTAAGASMLTLSGFRRWSDDLPQDGQQMPLLFVGHGSPMNAIEQNEFHKEWQRIGKELPRPTAILCISAHWETQGTWVTAMEKPKTIHDFGGFPQALFDVQYPAPGDPALAEHTASLVKSTPVGLDQQWGLDHGCWSVIRPMFPDADIPVLQLSLDYTRPPEWHYALAAELAALRSKGVLILGSGNMVHNLRMASFRNPQGYDWAIEINEMLKKRINERDHKGVIDYRSLGTAATLAVPTTEHYLPLLYVLGLQGKNEPLTFFNDKTMMGSISMTSVKVG
ncbi:MAG: 4,5-DOPA dioxygenase extradiol [Armatimonadetes bacterium]|nr:4,5-DOPA dioxygenase extradiol [Armatimonadota bacterium]